MPNDRPPWPAVYQQTRLWLDAGVFEAIIGHLRMLIRLGDGRAPKPTVMILDKSTPERGDRDGWDGAKRRRGSKVHFVIDTLGHLLALHLTPANEQDRDQMVTLVAAVQRVTRETVTLAYVDAGYTGQAPKDAAAQHGITLSVVKLPEAKRGFVLLPHRWVVERDFAWMSRFRV